MTHYDLLPRMVVHRPRKRTFEELTHFHADEYVDFLRMVTPENQDEYIQQLRRYNLGLPGEADWCAGPRCFGYDWLFIVYDLARSRGDAGPGRGRAGPALGF